MHSMGIMIRQRETRRDDFFTRYEPAAIPQDAEAREREGRTKAVLAEPLSAEVVVGGDGEARVQVEAVARDGFVDERGRGLGWPSLSPVSSLTFSRMPRCVASRARTSAKERSGGARPLAVALLAACRDRDLVADAVHEYVLAI
jgi:hypothetical protein